MYIAQKGKDGQKKVIWPRGRKATITKRKSYGSLKTNFEIQLFMGRREKKIRMRRKKVLRWDKSLRQACSRIDIFCTHGKRNVRKLHSRAILPAPWQKGKR